MSVKTRLVSDYNRWLADRTVVVKPVGWVPFAPASTRAIVQTPWLDRHNDCIQLTIEIIGDELLLTDEGLAIGDWVDAGRDPNAPSLREVLCGFGVQRAGQVLQVRGPAETFAPKMHALLQVVMVVSHMAVPHFQP